MDEFINAIKNGVNEFKNFKEKPIRIIGHLDSVTGSQKILVKINDKIKKLTFKELFDGCSTIFNFTKRIDGKKCTFPSNIEVLSVNKNHDIVWSDVKSVLKRKTKKKIYRVSTRIGEVEVTEDHSLITMKEDKLVCEKPEKIKFIASPYKYPDSGNDLPEINLLDHKELLPSYVLDKKCPGFIKIKYSPIRTKIPIKIKLDHIFLNFLGLWVADGHLARAKRSHSVFIASYADKECKKIINEISKLFNSSVAVTDKGISACIGSKVLYNLIKFLGFKGNSRTKFVPSFVFNLRKDLIASFLCGYFSGDGSVSKGDINVTSYSKTLIDDIQTLLLFLGIRSCIRKDNVGFKLSINANEMKQRFLEKIKFLQEYKNKLIKISNSANYQDLIPVSKNFIRNIYKNLLSPHKRYFGELLRNNKVPTRRKLLDIYNNFDIVEGKSFILNHNHNLFWEKKRNLKLISENKFVDVYDIETEEGNFICNNLVLKNSDGIAASSILIQSLRKENIKFAVSIVRQIDKELIEELKREDYEVFFFVDLGSGYLDLINSLDKKVFILDHHKPDKIEIRKNIVHLNPHLFGVDGAMSVSGAGVVYLFCKEFNENNKDLAYLAIIGAVGDIQELNGFVGVNNLILNDAIESGKLEIKKGLRMFGSQTKPLYKILQYSTDPFIPNVTGSEEGAKLFLKEIGISLKEDGKWRKLIHLDEGEMKKLVTSIILKRLGSEKNPEDVLGNIYLLTEEKEESSTKDVREFSTLLNATGRMGKSSLGMGACFGNKKLKKEANDLLLDYKKELIEALDWFYKNRRSKNVLEKDNFVIINAGDVIRDTLIGTVASIISKSNLYKEGTVIVSMAYTIDGDIKASIRCVGRTEMDLVMMIKKVVNKVGGLAGGHTKAAGAIIPQNEEENFMRELIDVLNKEILVK